MSILKKKVIVAGHICLDITPVFEKKKFTNLGELFKPGKLINVKEAHVHTGGAVANSGLAMKFLGADVTLAGKVGDDAFGDMVRNLLQEHGNGAGDGLIVGKGEFTSYSVILAVPGVDRIFLHNPGANNTFRAEDISEDALKDAALFHLGYPPLMRSMYMDDGDELVKLMKKVKEAGTATSLDMAFVDPDSEGASIDWKRILENVLPYVDFFVPSVEELCFMLDRERFASWQERAAGQDITEILDIEKDIRPLADQCMAMGAKVLVIKCGVPGLYYRTAGEEVMRGIGEKAGLDHKAWANQEGFEISYVPERVLSGTGCGDTSVAAFLTAMLEDYSLEDCMHMAAGTGASCVAAYDALSGLKNFEELKEKIDQGWEKYDLDRSFS